MLRLRTGPIRQILLLGAHSDDIEIGCGGTILTLAQRHPEAHVHWIVLSATEGRAAEARASAGEFLAGFASSRIRFGDFRDGFFPWQGDRVKEWFEGLKRQVDPDLVFTHHGADRHQDHRLVRELTWNTFRDHLVLEYEIPKYESDLGRPNLYVPLAAATAERKVRFLLDRFPSQAGKRWFDEELFAGLMRLRGAQCNAPERMAEAFHAEKLTLES